MTSDPPVFVFAGPIRMEYFLLPDGKAYSRLLGGPALYAAAGAKPWTQEGIGILARVGANIDAPAIQKIAEWGLDCSGIRMLPAHPPSIGFHYYEAWEKHIDWDPVKFFAKRRLECPQELLEYIPPSISENSVSSYPDIALRRDDIPSQYHPVRAVYLAPCHYQSQVTLSVAFRQCGAGTILLSPPEGLLLPSFRMQVREILHGIDILFAREEPVRAFVGGDFPDAAGISEHLSQWGPKIIILQKGFQGMHAYDSVSRKGYFVPLYPTEIKNPLAIGDSFCGGFLAEWRKTYDLLESTLAGCISASLAVEGVGALYSLQRNPGLAQARWSSLRRSLAK